MALQYCFIFGLLATAFATNCNELDLHDDEAEQKLMTILASFGGLEVANWKFKGPYCAKNGVNLKTCDIGLCTAPQLQFPGDKVPQ